ncbi:unnamed protein product [Pleuronectes platessa]|uniref:Uncharacterized protein n=1 Tax=Pleuronectes platessa TaxID=8262 RepID=A0A9N7V0W6_PLEPL|nr:unnamed protein product [Pleuronectes platessa]
MEADISYTYWKQLTNYNRVGQLANQGRMGFIEETTKRTRLPCMICNTEGDCPSHLGFGGTPTWLGDQTDVMKSIEKSILGRSVHAVTSTRSESSCGSQDELLGLGLKLKPSRSQWRVFIILDALF